MWEMACAKARRRYTPLSAKGIREVAVVRESKVEGQSGQILGPVCQALGGDQSAQPGHIAAQGDSGRPVECTGKVKWRAVEAHRELSQARKRVDSFVDRDLHGLTEIAMAAFCE